MTRGKQNQIIAGNRLLIIERLVARSREWNWSPGYTAAVIAAQTSPSRLRCGVYGPCTYCGDWIASVVDHVYPLARGGEHVQANVTSACAACNSEKSDQLPTQWIGMKWSEWQRRMTLEDALWTE